MSGTVRGLFRAVNGRIQGWVVVHLELPVKLETAFSGQSLLPKAVKAPGEVVALFFENRQALTVAVGVSYGRVGAFNLFGGMEELEREDGEAVDDDAGALGIQLGFGVGQVERAQMIKQDHVAAFSEVVAALVDAVDGALYFRQVVVCGMGCAGIVFCVPKLEVGKVLGDHHIEKCSVALRR